MEEVKYCLYARKSMESEERQVMSIESQIKEMLKIAERENLTVVEIREEAHSAKAAGTRPVFTSLLEDIETGKFSGILTWAPDRLSRNAGDLGALVDLMDNQYLQQIWTYGQKFTNSPSEKFLLMILGSQAKLENDNRSVNVKRGLRAAVERGLWPNLAPVGYLNHPTKGFEGHLVLDPERAPVVKQIFEKMAHEHWSGRDIHEWLKSDIGFTTRGGKPLAHSGVQRILVNSFYTGTFEYPRGSGNWHQGAHEPLVTKELYDIARVWLTRHNIRRRNKEFAFTKLLRCGLCGSGIGAEEKHKALKDGTTARYIYYGCTRGKDRFCKNTYIREARLIELLLPVIDAVELDDLGMRATLEAEVDRFNSFQKVVYDEDPRQGYVDNVDIRMYAKYLLQEGSITEKRQLLGNLHGRLLYKYGAISVEEQDQRALNIRAAELE